MKNKVEVGIRLISLEDNSITINNANKISKEVAFEKCGFNITTHVIINRSKNLISLRMDFTLIIQDKELKEQLEDTNSLPEFKYSGLIAFNIKGIELSPTVANKVSLSKDLMHKLVETAYSTFRGVIFAKTNGTSIQGAILPIINDEQIAKIAAPTPTK